MIIWRQHEQRVGEGGCPVWMAKGFGQRSLGLVHLAKQHPPTCCGVGADTQLLGHIDAEAGCLEVREGWLMRHMPS